MASNSVRLSSGNLMPLLGLGTAMGDPGVVQTACLKAIEIGYRHFDTAFLYGTEEPLGEAIKVAIETGIVTREELFVVTKLPNNGHRPEKVKYFLKLSLEKLKLAYVDMYLVHTPVPVKYVTDFDFFPGMGDNVKFDNADHLSLWREMENCVDEGLTKDIGLSNFNSQQIRAIYDAARIKPSNLQVECHAFLQQEKLFNFCRQLGIVLTAYSPFGSPMIAQHAKEKYNIIYPDNPKVLENTVLIELSKKYNKTTAQIVLRWMSQRGICAVPKSFNASRQQQNFQIRDFVIKPEDMEKIRLVNQDLRIVDFKIIPGITEHDSYPFNIEY